MVDLVNKNRDTKPTILMEHHGDIMGAYHQQIMIWVQNNWAAIYRTRLIGTTMLGGTGRPCVGKSSAGHPADQAILLEMV